MEKYGVSQGVLGEITVLSIVCKYRYMGYEDVRKDIWVIRV